MDMRNRSEEEAAAHQMMMQRVAAAAAAPMMMMRQRTSSSATIACQDCGNQAKKDCLHMRCRTCCKSRGFDCATHVRSTWVPAAKRRERQQAEIAAINAGQPPPKSKRARTIAMAASAAGTSSGAVPHHQHQQLGTANSYASTSTGGSPPSSAPPLPPHEHLHPSSSMLASHAQSSAAGATAAVAELPPEIKAQALFQCVRVRGIGGGDVQEEYAYRAVVRIGGRIFKGLLHDQGPWALAESKVVGGGGGLQSIPQQLQPLSATISELQLGGASSRGGGGASGGCLPMSTALIDLASIYGASATNSLLGGKDSNIPGHF